MRTITRINRALERAGVEERLVRSREGYYYIAPPHPIQCSIYAFALPATEESFVSTAREINNAFTDAGLPAPIKEVQS